MSSSRAPRPHPSARPYPSRSSVSGRGTLRKAGERRGGKRVSLESAPPREPLSYQALTLPATRVAPAGRPPPESLWVAPPPSISSLGRSRPSSTSHGVRVQAGTRVRRLSPRPEYLGGRQIPHRRRDRVKKDLCRRSLRASYT